jgi:hypothetical protein
MQTVRYYEEEQEFEGTEEQRVTHRVQMAIAAAAHILSGKGTDRENRAWDIVSGAGDDIPPKASKYLEDKKATRQRLSAADEKNLRAHKMRNAPISAQLDKEEERLLQVINQRLRAG